MTNQEKIKTENKQRKTMTNQEKIQKLFNAFSAIEMLDEFQKSARILGETTAITYAVQRDYNNNIKRGLLQIIDELLED